MKHPHVNQSPSSSAEHLSRTLSKSPRCMRAVGTSSSATVCPLSSLVIRTAVEGASRSSSVTACKNVEDYSHPVSLAAGPCYARTLRVPAL